MTTLIVPRMPRPRCLVHPGLAGVVRIRSCVAAASRHFRLHLEPGRNLQDAIVQPLSELGVTCACMTVLGGAFSSMSFCVAPPDPTGERAAAYSSPIDAGRALLIFGNATMGTDTHGRLMLHCHGVLRNQAGQTRGGHIVAHGSIVASGGVTVLATVLDGVELRITPDDETRMPVFLPFLSESLHV